MSQETRGATVPVGNSNSYNAQQSSSDPIDDERVEIINQASRDSSANYCFIHNLLKQQSKYQDCSRSCDNGCGGNGWCQLRQTMYESDMGNYGIAQTTLMERANYRESEVEHRDIREELPSFWVLETPGSKRFRAFWNSGIHLPDELEQFCVNPIIGHRNPALAA